MYNSSILIFHVPRSLFPSCCPSRYGVHPVGQSPLSPMCYLELACGPAYTGTLAPPSQWGAHVLFPKVLKGPHKSFYHLAHCCCCLVGKGLTSPPCWWTSGVATLSSTISSSTWFIIETHVLLVLLSKLVPKSQSPKIAMLVHHIVLFCSRVMC
jgi:hypothetical protein